MLGNVTDGSTVEQLVIPSGSLNQIIGKPQVWGETGIYFFNQAVLADYGELFFVDNSIISPTIAMIFSEAYPRCDYDIDPNTGIVVRTRNGKLEIINSQAVIEKTITITDTDDGEYKYIITPIFLPDGSKVVYQYYIANKDTIITNIKFFMYDIPNDENILLQENFGGRVYLSKDGSLLLYEASKLTSDHQITFIFSASDGQKLSEFTLAESFGYGRAINTNYEIVSLSRWNDQGV